MDESFIPLFPDGVKAAGGAGLKVVPAPGSSEPFQALESSPPAPAPHPGCATTASQPVVTLHRDGTRVARIHIRCGCGQEIELECNYPAPAAPVEAPPAKSEPAKPARSRSSSRAK